MGMPQPDISAGRLNIPLENTEIRDLQNVISKGADDTYQLMQDWKNRENHMRQNMLEDVRAKTMQEYAKEQRNQAYSQQQAINAHQNKFQQHMAKQKAIIDSVLEEQKHEHRQAEATHQTQLGLDAQKAGLTFLTGDVRKYVKGPDGKEYIKVNKFGDLNTSELRDDLKLDPKLINQVYMNMNDPKFLAYLKFIEEQQKAGQGNTTNSQNNQGNGT